LRAVDIRALSRLPRLSHLDLSSASQVEDGLPLDVLGTLTALTHLVLPLKVPGRVDPTPLGELQGLVHLDASSVITSDLNFLVRLVDLQVLALAGTGDGHATLSRLGGLRALHIGANGGIRTLAALSGLASLTELGLGALADLADLSPLAPLSALRSLSLSGCGRVTDLGPLARFTQLESLSLGGAFTDLAPLGGLRQLQSLALAGCDRLEDLSPLAPRDPPRGFGAWIGRLLGRPASELGGLTSLRALSLRSCRRVRDLSPLQKLDHLVDLTLADLGEVTSLTSLGAMRGLRGLSLEGAGFGRVTDLSPLEGLTDLRHLRLDGFGPRDALPRLAQATELC
jgi:Leucine-rich repeat (LRR) protein